MLTMNTLAMEQVNSILQGFGASRGMQGVELDEDGVCAFEYQGLLKLVLELSGDGGTLHLYSALCPVPAEGREAFLADLLERNLLCAETNGMTLALHAAENSVVLCYNQSVEDLAAASFDRLVENFLDTALTLQSELEAQEGFATSEEPASKDDSPVGVGMGLRI